MLIFVFMKILAMKVESFDAGESFDGPSSSIAQTISQYQPNINSNTMMNLPFITILDLEFSFLFSLTLKGTRVSGEIVLLSISDKNVEFLLGAQQKNF